MRKVYISTATQRYLYVLCLSSYLYARLCRVRRPVLAGRRSSDGRAPSHHKAVRTQHIYYCAPGGGGASVGGSAGCQEVRAFIKDTRPKTNTFAKVLQNLSAKRGKSQGSAVTSPLILGIPNQGSRRKISSLTHASRTHCI